jgi:RNA polymerase sigma factor (TIGR02999 family)
MNQVTQLLQALDRGDGKSADELLPVLYEELRKLAASKMAREAPGQTLQPTALVHEAWMRLVGGASPRFNDRAHFFGAAAEAMRRILIDRARRKAARRHGGDQQRVDVDEIEIAAPVQDDELLAVNEALEKFAGVDAPKAELVKLRFFAGLTLEEAAGVLGVSEPTAKRWWAYARAWLFEECANQKPEVREVESGILNSRASTLE